MLLTSYLLLSSSFTFNITVHVLSICWCSVVLWIPPCYFGSVSRSSDFSKVISSYWQCSCVCFWRLEIIKSVPPVPHVGTGKSLDMCDLWSVILLSCEFMHFTGGALINVFLFTGISMGWAVEGSYSLTCVNFSVKTVWPLCKSCDPKFSNELTLQIQKEIICGWLCILLD